MAITTTYSVPSSPSSAFPIGSPPSSSPSSWVPFVVTQEEFNSFHNIDRTLYSRLVIKLRRNPMGSVHVMALWIWFERAGYHKGNLVNLMLSFPDPVIGALADEAVICLMCVEREHYQPENDHQQIPLTQSLTGAALTLQFFHENRAIVKTAVMKIVNDVCLKAFQDIMQEATRLQNPNPNPPSSHTSHFANYNPNPNNNTSFHVPNPGPSGGFYTGIPRDSPSLATPRPSYSSPPANLAAPFSYFSNPAMLPIPSSGTSSSSGNVPQPCAPPFVKEGGYMDLLTRPSHQFEVEDHKKFLDNEIADVLDRLHIEVSGESGIDQEVGEHRQEAVPPDERTIFLTFSKGYPISENEVRDFFTRRFGNCFEAIYMQEVNAPGEQALYARLVVRPDCTTDVVLNGKSKVKFTINGKHVWARKYVRKNPKSPPASSSPSSSPTWSPASLPLMMGTSSSHSNPSMQFGSI